MREEEESGGLECSYEWLVRVGGSYWRSGPESEADAEGRRDGTMEGVREEGKESEPLLASLGGSSPH